MNSIYILLLSLIFFYFFGYRFYAKIIEKNLIEPGENSTPANSMADGVDFVPAKKMVLFGHHFASIAGAGPIIGPIVALVNFGWLAALGWIAIGNVFIGAVHDYLTLMISVRHHGSSIADIAEGVMGVRAKNIFSIFLYLALVLVIAVFGVVGSMTLVAQPKMVIPTFFLIPLAIFFGYAVYHKNAPLISMTVVTVGLNFAAIYVGYFFPVELPESGFLGMSPLNFWFLVLIIYAGVASIMPVNLLLQPRDYIATFNLYIAMALGIGGILYTMPVINAPPIVAVFSESQGPVWPMLFVLVACGAVSGFHSLVSSGTTSKQLAHEREGKLIAFGGMLVEGLLAVVTLILVGGGLYWTKPEGIEVDMAKLGLHEVMKSGGWVVTFGNGFGHVVSEMLPFLGFSIASMIAMIALNTFILTTLDTSTRIARFILEESAGKKNPVFRNKYVALAFVMIPVFLMGITSSYSKIWPVFGATNQLIAALALIVITSYLVGIKKPTKYTLVPAIFMTITTIGALGWQAYQFIFGKTPEYLLGGLSVFLILLALFIGNEGWAVFKKQK